MKSQLNQSLSINNNNKTDHIKQPNYNNNIQSNIHNHHLYQKSSVNTHIINNTNIKYNTQKSPHKSPNNKPKSKPPINQQVLAIIQSNKYIQNILILLQQQVQLQLTIPTPPKTNKISYSHLSKLPPQPQSILIQVLGSQLKQYLQQIRIQRLKIYRVSMKQQQVYSQYIQNSIHKILQLNQKINKIKQFYLYCKYLKNHNSQLQDNIEKYYQYAKKQPILIQQLQSYLNNPIVSDIIFKQYLKTYNVNIFTSDLIVHYFQLNLKGLLRQSQIRVFEAQRIPQLCLLQKKNVVFKQLYEINEKYSSLLQQMKHSYMNNIILIISKYQQTGYNQQLSNGTGDNKESNNKQDNSNNNNNRNNNNNKQDNRQQNKQKISRNKDTFVQYNSAINQKLQNLNYLINKMAIMGNNLIQNIQSTQIPVLVNQYQENYNHLTSYLQFKHHLTSTQSNSYQSPLNSNNGNSNNNNAHIKHTKNNNNATSTLSLHQKYKMFLASIFINQNITNPKQSLTTFFEQNLIFLSNNQGDIQLQCSDDINNPQKFQFLQQKIIKTQSLIVLNKIFSTFNMFSYILQQINPSSCKQTQYTFTSLTKHIQNQFRNQFIKKQSQSSYNNQKQSNNQFNNNTSNNNTKHQIKRNYHSPSHKAHHNVFMQTDQFGNWILLSGNKKLIYPSAINALTQLLHSMISTATLLQKKGLYSNQLMLQILSLKGQQVSKIGQVIYNIYNLIKSKQVNCYYLLNDYMRVILKGCFEQQINWIDNLDLTVEEHQLFINQLQDIQQNKINNQKQQNNNLLQIQKQYLQQRKRVASQITHARITRFLTYYAQKAKKADFLSQIIYQLDSNYQIYHVLQQLLTSQQYHNKTFYFHDNPQFYQTVLYQIIQMRNHIKLDHYFTLPRLHQAFGFFTVKALSFGDILNQLAQFSIKQIKIQQLLIFFKTQLKLKRAVFRGQLYWLSYKNSVQNGKDKIFKQFVQQQAKDILQLAQQPLQYFLLNMKDFVKKVNIFEEQIQKFKYCQTLIGKMNQSKYKIKNIQSYLSVLSCSQLKLLSKSLCYFNPINKILKNESISQQLFSDIKMSIQLNNRIRFQDISRNVFMLQQRQKLSQQLFIMRSFGFDLSYIDCFNILVQQSKKSYISSNESLKLLINRQKQSIIKHYQQILLQDNKNIHLAISFYKCLTLVSLLSIRQQINDQNDLDIINLLLAHISKPLNVIDEINRVKQIFTTNKQFQFHQKQQNNHSEIYKLLKIKSSLNRLSLLSQQTHEKYLFNSLQQQNHSISTICLVAKLSTYTQKRIVQKIQLIHHQIIQKQTTNNKKILKQLNCLNNKIIQLFMNVMTKCQHDYYFNTSSKMLNTSNKMLNTSNTMLNTSNKIKLINNKSQIIQLQSHHQQQQSNKQFIQFTNIEQSLQQVQSLLLTKIIQLTKYKSILYQNKQQLYLFDTHCGYKIKPQLQQNQSTTNNIRNKDTMMRRNDRKLIKKGLFSPVRSAHTAQNNIMQNIQKRVGIQMIKQSMGLRKVISKLQLQQKKMKDQIAWQTSKLQHNVIKRIHAFITQSNMDQQQSYINFKYTVNLQTIKGMQNVIKQQTQLAMKATQQTMKKQYTKQEMLKHQLQHHHKLDHNNNNNNQDKIQDEIQYKQQLFLTNPTHAQSHHNHPRSPHNIVDEQQTTLGYQNSHMLNTNIESIFNHMKKIKVFAAWKKIHRNMDLTNEQWKSFNKNVANILHNDQNIKKVQIINKKRNQCFKQNILCSLLKQENKILSQKIKNSKIQQLMNIVQEYRYKLLNNHNQDKQQIK